MVNAKPKVLFEIYVIPHYQVPFLTELNKHVDLLVMASRDKTVKGLKDIQDNLPFKNIRVESSKRGIYHPEIFNVIESFKPNVIVSWNTSLRTMLMDKRINIILREKKIKTIWTGCDGYETQNFFVGLLAEFLPWRLGRTLRDFLVTRRVTHFIAHSSHMQNFLRRVKLVPQRKITLTHNAIDTSKISDLYKLWKGQGKPRKSYGIIFTGRLIFGKKIDMLVKAFKAILPDYPEATLTIVGEGPAKENLEKLSQDLGIQNNIIFTGGIYDDALLAEPLYDNSLFILPGVGGLSFNTAMSCGLTIIHTHADGTEKDLIQNGVNGWFFDGGEKDLIKKIKGAFQDPKKLKVMGEKSEDFITNKFNLQNMINDYVKVIERVACINQENEK